MKKKQTRSIFPDDMDKEMIPLCKELNSFKGIETTFCCFGHGDPKNFYITMKCSNIKSAKYISKTFDEYSRHNDIKFVISIDWIGPGAKPNKNNQIAIDIRIDYKWNFEFEHEDDFIKRMRCIVETDIKNLCKELRKNKTNFKVSKGK